MKKWIILLACIAVLLSGGAVSATGQNAAVAEGYEMVAENSGYRLYANLKTGDFSVLDIAADRFWYSGQWDVLDKESPVSGLNSGRVKTDLVSVIGVSYVQVSTIASTAVPSYQNSYAYSVTKDNVTVKKIKKGYRADYYFKDIDSTVPVEITLHDGGLSARIIGSELVIGKEYRVTAIDLLPGFLAADDRYDGYLFVPSGSGGIIPLNSGRGDIATYSEMVYGEDTAVETEEYTGEAQNILVPVYGMKCGDTAVTAVISAGDSSARITAGANSSSTSFTRIYSQYVTAIVDSTTLFESDYSNQRIIYGAEQREKFSDYTVDFYFLRGKDANYSGMAAVYRTLLALKQKAAPPQLCLTLYGAATKKASFLGIPYTKTFALTDFADVRRIIEDLNDSGIPVSLQYIGWNNNGVENKTVPTKLSPVGVLGGKSGFKKLDQALEKTDNTVYYDIDFFTIRKSGRGFSVLSDVCESMFHTRTPIYKYMRSVYVPVNNENPSYLLTSGKVACAAEKYFSKYTAVGGASLYGIGEKLYSNFSGDTDMRSDTINHFIKVLTGAGKKSGSVAVNGGNAYVYPYVDTIYSLPLCCDGNQLFSQSVPFVQMLLHGAVNYGAGVGDSLLDCIEYGANPYYRGIAADDSTLMETSFNWLYGTTYESWSDTAKEQFSAYQEAYRQLYNQTIISHSSDNGVSETVFENGMVILVNRSNTAAFAYETEIPAHDYRVIGGGAK